MRTIAIMNLKGGVGKTVTSLNLAAALSCADKNILAVDCDGQMSLTRFYFPNLDPDRNLTVADVLQGTGKTVWEDNVIPVSEHISILPASSALYGLDVAAIRRGGNGLTALRGFRDAVAEDREVDYMIFDCPPGFTAASVGALMAADEVVIPMLVDGFSMWGVSDMASQINGIKSANPRIKVAGVLITQWRNTEVVQQGEKLLRSLSVPVFRTVIRRTDKIPESTFDRSSIYDYSPRSAAGIDYRRWVREYLGEECEHGKI